MAKVYPFSEALRPGVTTAPPNPPLELHKGDFRVSQGSTRVRLRGLVSLVWLPSPEVRFSGTTTDAPGRALELGPVSVTCGEGVLRGDGHILSATFGPESQVRGIIAPMAVEGRRRSVKEIRFGLTNFHRYFGRVTQSSGSSLTDRLSLHAHGWRVTLDQQGNPKEAWDTLRSQGGFLVSHTGLLRRVGNKQISYSLAQDHLFSLHYFFGFLRGAWCGPVAAEGFTNQGSAWRTLGSWLVTPWRGREIRSWFPRALPVPETISSLYGSFRRRWNTPHWRNALPFAISWHVAANADSRTLEAAIVQTCIALELLAWAYCVEDRRYYSANRFHDLGGEGRLRALLKHLNIPTQVPPFFPELMKATRRRHFADGVAILTRVRNALVHPTRSKRRFLHYLPHLRRVEIREMALQYVEWCLLAVLGYDDLHQERRLRGYAAEATVPVPWA
jgi:hypothetical protein